MSGPLHINITMSKRPASPLNSAVKVRRTRNPLLPHEKKEIVRLHEQGEKTRTIAQVLDRPLGTIYYFLNRFKEANEAETTVAPETVMEMSMTNDAEVAEEIIQVINKGGYSPKQVLNFQKTGLLWKMMSRLICAEAEERTAAEIKASKDRVTLVIGGNAEGDWKLKPLLVYHTENPRSLNGYIKEHLPVIWKAHPKEEVTINLYQSYVIGYLSPACTEYAMANNLPNKFLLIVEEGPALPRLMNQWAENIEVVFLPPNSAHLMQPMDQGVTAAFEQYYLRRVMQQLVKATYGEDKPTIKEFWRRYNIKKAIHNISYSWNEMEQSTMNAVWHDVWPEVAHNSWGLQEIERRQQQLAQDIVRLSNLAGMSMVDEQRVEELLAIHAKVLSDEELGQVQPEDTQEPESQQLPQGMTNKELKDLLDTVNKAISIAEIHDLNVSRSDEFSRALEYATQRYQRMYNGIH